MNDQTRNRGRPMNEYRIKRIVEEIWHTEANSRKEALENITDNLGCDSISIKSETCVKVKEITSQSEEEK